MSALPAPDCSHLPARGRGSRSQARVLSPRCPVSCWRAGTPPASQQGYKFCESTKTPCKSLLMKIVKYSFTGRKGHGIFVFFPQFREIVCCFCPPVRCPEAEPGAACMGGVGFIHAEAGAVIPSENYLTLKERERLTPGETQPWHSAGQQ